MDRAEEFIHLRPRRDGVLPKRGRWPLSVVVGGSGYCPGTLLALRRCLLCGGELTCSASAHDEIGLRVIRSKTRHVEDLGGLKLVRMRLNDSRFIACARVRRAPAGAANQWRRRSALHFVQLRTTNAPSIEPPAR
jgi:hypothetical protein